MLCDDVIRFARSRRTRWRPYAKEMAEQCARQIENAERFVLDQDAVDVILNVEESKPSSLLAGLSLCRLPFPVMWVEYDLLYRMQEQTIKYGYPKAYPDHARVITGGLLIVASDDTLRRGTVYGCSDTDYEKSPTINPISFEFDWHPPPDNRIIPIHAAKYPVRYGRSSFEIHPPDAPFADNKYTRGISRLPDELAALRTIEHLYKHTIDPVSGFVMEGIQRDMDHAAFNQLIDQSCSDWMGEKRWLLGLMLLLNTRNLVDYENFSVKRQNHGRSPRVLPALVSHRVVKIKFTRVAMNRAASQGVPSGEAMRWHKVRGHWKVRKTGVFFWRPHHRGDLTKGAVKHDYHVTS